MAKAVFKLYVSGDIDNDSYIAFSKQLAEVETHYIPKSIDNPIVELELISHGGDAYAAMAFYDRIKDSRVSVNITAIGFVASAATLILAAGDKRRMTKNAWIMVHEDIVPLDENMRVSKVEREASHARDLEVQWNLLLEKETSTSADEWDRLNKEEKYLNAKQCELLGLIEEII